MPTPISITPQDFLDMFSPKVVISGDGSQQGNYWNKILPYIAGLASGIAVIPANAALLTTGAGDGTDTVIIPNLTGVLQARILLVIVANTNYTFGVEITSYDDATGTFVFIDAIALDIPITVVYTYS